MLTIISATIVVTSIAVVVVVVVVVVVIMAWPVVIYMERCSAIGSTASSGSITYSIYVPSV